MQEPQPQEVRDKILGLLYPRFPSGRTRDEIAADSGVNVGLIQRELVHLLQSEQVRWEGQTSLPPDLPEFFSVLVSTANIKFAITALGRLSIEGENRKAPKTKQDSRAFLTDIGPQPQRANDLLDGARAWSSRAEASLKNQDHSNAVASGQKAIEFSAKSIVLLSGFEPPKDHAIGRGLSHVIGRLAGEDWAMRLTVAEIARLAWLNETSAPLQEVAEYGYLGVSAREVVTGSDAETWVKHARESIGVAERFAGLLQGGQLKLRCGGPAPWKVTACLKTHPT